MVPPCPAPAGATDVALPRFVQIEPVGQCNLSCRMCPVVYRGEGGVRGQPAALIAFDDFRRVIDQFPGLSELHLQGMGEPFLHPRLFEMVRYAAARRIEVSTNTNLTALSDRRAEECVRSGLKRLFVSLDAADAAIYESIRVGSQFRRVVRNLERLMQARRRLASETPHVALVAVAMRANLEQLAALVRLAHAHGVPEVNVQHLAHDFGEATLPPRYVPMRRFVDDETLMHVDARDVERAFGEARAAAREVGVALSLPSIATGPARVQSRRGRQRCDWPWRGAYVAYSGQAMPCCMIATPDRLSLGNMIAAPVASVWRGEAYEAFRRRLDSDDPPEVCRGCAVYNGTF